MKVSNSLGVQTQTNTEISKPTKEAKPDDQCIINSLTLDSKFLLNPLLGKTDNIPAVNLNPVEPKPEDCNKKEDLSCIDKVVNTTNVIGNTVNIGGTILTVPGEAIKHAATVKKLANTVMAGSMIHLSVSTPASVQEKLMITVARSAAKVIRVSEGVSVAATKLNYEKASGVANKKILPTVNAVLSGISIYTNTKRFKKAEAAHNTIEMVKAGTQITLNAVSGVTGYMPGKGQVISAVTGLSTLASDKVIDLSVSLYNRITK